MFFEEKLRINKNSFATNTECYWLYQLREVMRLALIVKVEKEISINNMKHGNKKIWNHCTLAFKMALDRSRRKLRICPAHPKQELVKEL